MGPSLRNMAIRLRPLRAGFVVWSHAVGVLAACVLSSTVRAGTDDQPPLGASLSVATLQQADASLRAWVVGTGETRKTTRLHAVLPAGCAFDHVEVRGSGLVAYLDMPAEWLSYLTDEQCEQIIRAEIDVLRPLEGVTGVALYARPSGEPDAEYRPLPSYLGPALPIVNKPEPTAADVLKQIQAGTWGSAASKPAVAVPLGGGLPVYNPGRPAGALSGKTVFLSPGHGWAYVSSLGIWTTQRGNTFGMIEDLSNAEAVLNHLAQYLHNAGADVWPCRERDFNTNMVIIDNPDPAPGFEVTDTWPTSTAAGSWKGSNYQYHAVSTTETAVATYTPQIPESNYYSVYLWTPSASNRSTDARVRVNHTGGTTTHLLNMQRNGNTWRFIGTYYFHAGRDAAKGSVTISNQGSDPSKFVIADAVRFGGGMGDYVDGGTVSGKPRAEESGKYYPVFMGQPSTPYGTVDSMPRYAAWESESWEDSIYVSWHSNSDNGSFRGTDVYVYASGQGPGVPGSFALFDGVRGGDSLANRIYDQVLNDIHLAWDPDWIGRKFGAWLGEVNPANNDEMPACLLEVAYYDNQTDAQSLADPRFRDLVARAVYQGIVDWWYHDANGPSATPIPIDAKLPEPPTHLSVRNVANNTLRVSWSAPPHDTGDHLLGDAATSYLVCKSTDGYGFDDGTPTTTGSLDVHDLPEGAVYYFRVIAVNAGGQSFPSAIGGAKVSANNAAPILVVNGFDRLDRGQMLVEIDSENGKDLLRERPMRMNHYGYIRTFAEALEPTGFPFDFCAHEAVRDGQVTLAGYPLLVWQSGQEAEADHTFDDLEQSRVQAYLDGGGRMFVSGSEIAWDLDARGHGTSFFHNDLKASYVADDAGTYHVESAPGSLFVPVAPFSFDNGSTIYDVAHPDAISPFGGSRTILNYSGGTGGAAGVLFDGTFKLVYLGFPFEAITTPSARAAVMQAVLGFLFRSMGDFDADGDVDLSDFGHVQKCLSGTGTPQLDPDCLDTRLDDDADVDAADLGLFTQCFSGAQIPARPECRAPVP